MLHQAKLFTAHDHFCIARHIRGLLNRDGELSEGEVVQTCKKCRTRRKYAVEALCWNEMPTQSIMSATPTSSSSTSNTSSGVITSAVGPHQVER